MSGAQLEVLSSGPLLSVQDLGWQGHAHLGLGSGGVLDRAAARLANALAGNAATAAVLEVTWGGAALRFEDARQVAIGGADLRAELDGRPLACWTPAYTAPGSVLRFGTPRSGARACLAVSGGFAVAALLGSRSTELRAGFGGHEGRALHRADRLPLGPANLPPRPAGFSLDAHWLYPDRPFRFLPGAQHDDLDQASRVALVETEFAVDPNSDRMGLRLQPVLVLARPRELVSAPLVPGTIQLPPGGAPIVLTRACQTSGGYPSIGHVVSADLDRLAQLKPGDRLRFQQIGPDAAAALRQRRADAIAALCAAVARRYAAASR